MDFVELMMTLPEEIVYYLLMPLSNQDIARFSQTCSSLRQLIGSHQVLWRSRCRRDISTLVDPPDHDYHRLYVTTIPAIQYNPAQKYCLRVAMISTLEWLIRQNYDRLLEQLLVPARDYYGPRWMIHLIDLALAHSHLKIVLILLQPLTDLSIAFLSEIVNLIPTHDRVDIVELLGPAMASHFKYSSVIADWLSRKNDVTVLERILQARVTDPDTAIVAMARRGNCHLVQSLLSKVSVRALHQALHEAYCQRYFTLAKILVTAGAAWFDETDVDNTPMTS
jgi:hypothetical protein